jgi:hypothetical protein
MSEFAQPPQPDLNAGPFDRMAARIRLNSDQGGFGGAFVVVTPDGVAQEVLLLDNAQNPAIFWSIIKTRAEIAVAEIEDAQRQGGGFGRR